MSHTITLPLPKGWIVEQEVYTDEESGAEISHLEASFPNDKAKCNDGYIDMYVGPMPEDTTAQDEAFSNYVAMMDYDEKEDKDPLTEWPFMKKKAWGFEALCEDDAPLRVMCSEPKKDVLLIVTVIAKDDDTLASICETMDRDLRID